MGLVQMAQLIPFKINCREFESPMPVLFPLPCPQPIAMYDQKKGKQIRWAINAKDCNQVWPCKIKK